MRRGEYEANLHIAPASLLGRALKEKYFKKPLKPVDYHIRTYIYINLYLFRHKAILNRKIHVFINYKLLLVVAMYFPGYFTHKPLINGYRLREKFCNIKIITL